MELSISISQIPAHAIRMYNAVYGHGVIVQKQYASIIADEAKHRGIEFTKKTGKDGQVWFQIFA